MINFENVSKNKLKSISVHIPKGDIIGLVGASSAGKTTFIKLASGLLAPEKGRIRTLGKEPFSARKENAKKIGTFLYGIPLLDRNETVINGFKMLKSVYHIPPKQFEDDYQLLSNQLDFKNYESETLKNLSLGQRMRAEIGATLIHRPEIILLDEPDLGIDENGKSAICDILVQTCKTGATILISSNNFTGISAICSRIIILDNGKLIYCGSEKNLRKRYTPIDTMTIEFNGNIPDFEDLPLTKYRVDKSKFILSYNSNYITSAEIIKTILPQTNINQIRIEKPNLEDICRQIESKEKQNEPY